MEKLLVPSFFLLINSFSLYAQVHIAAIVGWSPALHLNEPKALIISDVPGREFLFNINRTSSQYYGGLKVLIEISEPFFIEAGVTYTARNNEYHCEYVVLFPGEETLLHSMTGNEKLLQFPINIGVNLNAIKINSGLMAIQPISAKSELEHMQGYSSERNSMKFGWLTGVSVGIKSIRSDFGIEYQKSFDRVCQGMYIHDESLAIRNVPGRFVLKYQFWFN